MSALMFFNDLACARQSTPEEVDVAMAEFVSLLVRITSIRSDTALVAEVALPGLELAPGFFLGAWAGQHRNRDHWRLIRRLQTRVPINAVLPEGAFDECEYRCQDRSAPALGAAHLLDGLLVSPPLDATWDTTQITAELVKINGEDEAVTVRHAAKTGHVAEHEEWLKVHGVQGFRWGLEIWEAREHLYPHLRFLPRVAEHFRKLSYAWIQPAARQLRLLNDSVAAWDPITHPSPSWQTHVTDESESRIKGLKSLYWLADGDGELYLFSLHARMTPGKGRIYFRLETGQKNGFNRAVVSHVGTKLGSDDDSRT